MNHLVDINKVLAAFDAEIGFRESMASLLEDRLKDVSDDKQVQEIYQPEIAFNIRGAKYLSSLRDFMYHAWKDGELS